MTPTVRTYYGSRVHVLATTDPTPEVRILELDDDEQPEDMSVTDGILLSPSEALTIAMALLACVGELEGRGAS